MGRVPNALGSDSRVRILGFGEIGICCWGGGDLLSLCGSDYGQRVCGRYTHLYKWKQLHRLLTLTTTPIEFKDRYNVAPTQDAPVVRQIADDDRGAGGGHGVSMLRWGLVPSWAKDVKIGASLINARAETVATKPAFRSAFVRRRCIVPVSGFYEWQRAEAVEESGGGLFGPVASAPKRAGKQPYYITSSDGEPLLLAGLWESWREPGSSGPALESYTIITTTPNEMIAKLHDRMPVILDAADCARWLDCRNTNRAGVDGLDTNSTGAKGPGVAAGVADLLRPFPAELMLCYRVSTRVNSPRFDDSLCMQEL